MISFAYGGSPQPAHAPENSLFEDNAEFGYGMLLAQQAIRDGLKAKVEEVAANENATAEVKAACQEWLDTFSVGATNGVATDKLVAALENVDCPTVTTEDPLGLLSQEVFIFQQFCSLSTSAVTVLKSY